MESVVRAHEHSRQSLQTSLNDAVEEFNAKLSDVGRMNTDLIAEKQAVNENLNAVEAALEAKTEEV
jgi:hypothetical protein